jgi:membrane associated rhomboid family serine protease
MFALALFGSILERVIGGKRFLFVFFISGIFAGIGSILFYTSTIGASGAIYGVMGTLAVIRSRMVVYMGFVPMPMAIAVALWAIGDFIGLFSPAGTVAYASHLFGLAFGLHTARTYGESTECLQAKGHDHARIERRKSGRVGRQVSALRASSFP